MSASLIYQNKASLGRRITFIAAIIAVSWQMLFHKQLARNPKTSEGIKLQREKPAISYTKVAKTPLKM